MGSGSEECECEESVGRELWGGQECGEGRECESVRILWRNVGKCEIVGREW